MKNYFVTLLVSFLALAAARSIIAAPVNLVQNGSFESGSYVPDSNDVMSLTPGSTVMTNWTTVNAELSWDDNGNTFGLTASSGAKQLDLTGYHDSTPYGGVKQTIPTVVGTSYVVGIDLGVNPTYGDTASITGSAANSSASFTFVSDTSGETWQHYNFRFTAISSSTSLSLIGASPSLMHIGLDNVTVYQSATVGLLGATSARVMSGGTANLGAIVTNTAPSAASLLNYSVSSAVLSGSATLGTNIAGTGSLAPSGSQAFTMPATSTTLGNTTISFTASDPYSSNGQLSVTSTMTVVGNRIVTATPTNFGVMHVGTSKTLSITLSTSGSDTQATRVTVANAGPDANGVSVSGGTNPLFNSISVTDTRTIATTFNNVGTYNTAILLSTSGEGLAGEAPVNVSAGYTAQVFSGKAQWNINGGGNWGSNGNWADTQAGGPNAGAPGLAGFANDTATFGSSNGTAATIVALNGASPTLSALTFNNTTGGSYTLTQGSAGVITLNNNTGDAAINLLGGSHQISAPLVIAKNTDVSISNATNRISITGQISGTGTLNVVGPGTLALMGSNAFTGSTIVSSGSLEVDTPLAGPAGPVTLQPLATLVANASMQRPIAGAASSQIVATSANLTLGDSTSFIGFSQAGTMTVGSNALTIGNKQFAGLGTLTTLAGGTINAPNGVYLGGACSFVGSGTINGKVSAALGSTINATGNLTLGDSKSPVGFVSSGELYTNASTVTILSNSAANNSNAVALGSLTQIDGGALNVPNGILLNSGNNVITTDSGGTISGGGNSRLLNHGNVQGPSSSSSNWLSINMPFKGSTGQTSGRIAFLGGFATGDSPGVNSQYGAAELAGAGTEFDLAGTAPGNGSGNYGQLNVLADPSDPADLGNLKLLPGTSFDIVDWDGFVATPGESFDVLNWEGTLDGTASLNIDPAFAAEGVRIEPQWNSNSLVLQVVPEPTSLGLLGAGVICFMARALRQLGLRSASAILRSPAPNSTSSERL